MAESHNKKWALSPKSHHSMGSIPGPGSYNVENALSMRASAPSFSMGGKYKSHTSMAPSPGPGTYNVGGCLNKLSNHGALGSYAMSPKGMDSDTACAKSKKTKKTRDGLLYGTRTSSSSSSSLSSSLLLQGSQTPGPGSYNIDTYPSKVGPAFSMASRIHKPKKSKSFVSSPGPGAYNVSSMGRAGSSYVVNTWH